MTACAVWRVLGAALLAALIGGCASTGEGVPQPDRSAQRGSDPGVGQVGETRDARSRAKAHADLASAYYELGNLGVALEEARIAVQADSNYAPAHNVLGLVNMELKDNATADANSSAGCCSARRIRTLTTTTGGSSARPGGRTSRSCGS
jgi:type IV pilus assembly protein PilF